MSSDQKFTTLTADGQVKTASGGSTNIGPARVTYIQATGVTNIKLYDAASASGGIVFESTLVALPETISEMELLSKIKEICYKSILLEKTKKK